MPFVPNVFISDEAMHDLRLYASGRESNPGMTAGFLLEAALREIARPDDEQPDAPSEEPPAKPRAERLTKARIIELQEELLALFKIPGMSSGGVSMENLAIQMEGRWGITPSQTQNLVGNLVGAGRLEVNMTRKPWRYSIPEPVAAPVEEQPSSPTTLETEELGTSKRERDVVVLPFRL